MSSLELSSGRDIGLILPHQEINQVRIYLTDSIIPVIGPNIRTQFERNLLAAEEKNGGEPTCEIDRSMTSKLRDLWICRFPEYPILAEDFQDPRLKGLTPEQIMAMPGVLVLDMVDGSGRMLDHDKIFSSSYGFMSYGRIVLGIVHRPIGDRLWWAQEGIRGAFRDGRTLHLSKKVDLMKSTVVTAYAWDRTGGGTRQEELDILQKIGRIPQQPAFNRGSSVLDTIKVAEGKLEAVLFIGLHPWDVGAAPFMIVNQGGLVTDDEGKPCNIFSRTMVAANNEQILNQFITEIARAKELIAQEKMLPQLLEQTQQENARLRQINERLERRRGIFFPEPHLPKLAFPELSFGPRIRTFAAASRLIAQFLMFRRE